MKQSGQIVLSSFPYTDFSGTKLRPVLMLRQVSANFDDWLVCMISSQIKQAEEGLDEIITPADADASCTYGNGWQNGSTRHLDNSVIPFPDRNDNNITRSW